MQYIVPCFSKNNTFLNSTIMCYPLPTFELQKFQKFHYLSVKPNLLSTQRPTNIPDEDKGSSDGTYARP